MNGYVIRRGASYLTATSQGYVWATATLALPMMVDRNTADELVDLYGGTAEEVTA